MSPEGKEARISKDALLSGMDVETQDSAIV